MDRRSALTASAWLVIGGLATWVVLASWIPSTSSRGTAAPADGTALPHGPSHGATNSAVLGGERENVRIASAIDREAWSVHDVIFSYTDVAGLADGRWVVLDGLGNRLHLLDRDLTLLGSFGGAGDGPGELSRPLRMAVVDDTVVAVLDVSGTRLELFSTEGAFLDRRSVQVPGCVGGVSDGLIADPVGALAAWGVCAGAEGPSWIAARIALDGEARTLASEPLLRDGRMSLVLGRGLLAWEGGLWLGRPDGCFEPLDAAGEPDRCLPAERPVPFPDEIRERLTTSPPGGPGSAGGRRGGAPPIDIPASMPPFIAARGSAAGPILLIPGPDGIEGSPGLLQEDGSLLLLRSEDAVFPGLREILVAREFREGTGFRRVAWP